VRFRADGSSARRYSRGAGRQHLALGGSRQGSGSRPAEAGLDNAAIALRLPDDGLQAIANPAAMTARAIDAVIAAGASSPALACAAGLVIECLADDWLDEIVRIEPAGPPSLCASAFPVGGAEPWRFTLTCGEGAMNLAAARRFLGVLHDLIGKPVAILV